MIKIQAKKSKATQYAIGGTVAVIVLGIWISFPLMSGSSLDSSASAGNPFHSKVADISSLDSDIPSEGGAPGSPLSGEMINNPATSGEDVASSLFQSGPESGDAASAENAPAGAGPAEAPGPSASAGGPGPAFPGGKLNAVASITSGNANSMTAGGVHNKFFGTGNQKAEFAPAAAPDLKKMAAGDNKGSMLMAMLGAASDKSQAAAKSGSIAAASGGASSAFGAGVSKGDMGNLNGDMEAKSLESGLQMGETAQDLKKNDPSINKHKITPPDVTPQKDDDAAKQMKQMIMQMIIQAVLKVALGAFGV